MKPITVMGRWQLANEIELDLVQLQRKVHLSPTVSGFVYTLQGVASNELDIVVTTDFDEPRHERDVPVIEVSKKAGKYDGKERDRIVLRRLPDHQATRLPSAELYALGSDTTQIELCVETEQGVAWSASYRRWTHKLADPEHAGDIMLWHWRRYYSFLDETEVRSLTSAFGDEVTSRQLDLADANRLASRKLYALARESGWRKLTLREQKAWGLEGQWHPIASIAKARSGSRTGCGEHTLLSASIAEYLDS